MTYPDVDNSYKISFSPSSLIYNLFSGNSERNHTVLPEYALPTLIHLLAHHPNMDNDNRDSLKSSLGEISTWSDLIL